MDRPHKYVSPLSDGQIGQSEELMRKSDPAGVRMRAHSILSRAEGYGTDGIAHICQTDRDSESSWTDEREQRGAEGLYDRTRSGQPPKLTESGIGVAGEPIKEHPHPPKIISAEISGK